MDYKSVGQRIKEVRKANGLTQAELADMTGLTENYISYIECGKRAPSFEAFVDILNALECRADVILQDVLAVGPDIKKYGFDSKLQGYTEDEIEKLYAIASILKGKQP